MVSTRGKSTTLRRKSLLLGPCGIFQRIDIFQESLVVGEEARTQEVVDRRRGSLERVSVLQDGRFGKKLRCWSVSPLVDLDISESKR